MGRAFRWLFHLDGTVEQGAGSTVLALAEQRRIARRTTTVSHAAEVVKYHFRISISIAVPQRVAHPFVPGPLVDVLPDVGGAKQVEVAGGGDFDEQRDLTTARSVASGPVALASGPMPEFYWRLGANRVIGQGFHFDPAGPAATGDLVEGHVQVRGIAFHPVLDAGQVGEVANPANQPIVQSLLRESHVFEPLSEAFRGVSVAF